MKNIIYPTFIFLSLFTILLGDLASPTPFTVRQPTGMKLNIFIRGNHLRNWYEYHGWSIVKNTADWWVYTSGVDGQKLLASDQMVGIDPEPDHNLQLSGITGKLIPEALVLEDDAPIPNLYSTRDDTFRVPMILVEFPDYGATYETSKFDSLMNYEGYTHLNYSSTGSFRDFYKEISYGQFIAGVDVSDWFTAEHNHDYYGYNNGYQRVKRLVRNMVDSLEAAGFDWSIYDNDGDGYVDALNLAHAGPGAEEGDETNIWSHKSSLGNLAVTYDGVIISSYNINPEKQMGNFVCIGVLAHEFGHALGLPDLYDTDYSSTGAGKLALMASGSWGTTGTSPWYPSTMIGWCKNELGWVDVIEFTNSQDGVEVEQTYSSNTIYKLQHPTVDDEYWYIENRQKIGSDTLMPRPGLTIWHIKESIASGWSPNNDEPYYGVALEQADGLFALENGGPSDGGDVFPGTTGNREFSHTTIPSTHSMYGEISMIRIDNISDPVPSMTLDIELNEIILAEASIGNGLGLTNQQGTFSIALANDQDMTELELELFFNPGIISITEVSPTARVSVDSIIIDAQRITLVNPLITAGNGDILDFTVQINTGVSTDVIITIPIAYGVNAAGDEVGIIANDFGTFSIAAVDQLFNIGNGSGTINGGASFSVSLVNTVPLQLGVLQFTLSPDLITFSDEPFQDLNGNQLYDSDEPFTDWNNNGLWSPILEHTGLATDWVLESQGIGSNLDLAFSNWSVPLAPGTHSLFQINGMVNAQAQLDDQVTISAQVFLLMDGWGNTGVPSPDISGTITIDQVLAQGQEQVIPDGFALRHIYPNPFNPSTTFVFTVSNNMNTPVSILIYDITGRRVTTLTDQVYSAGTHRLQWNASNLGAGIYFTEFQAGQVRQIKKVTLLK